MKIRNDQSTKPVPTTVNPIIPALLDHPDPPPTRIDADLLIPGRGEPIRSASLIYRGPKIEFVGTTTSLPANHATLTPITTVPVLMPGLWDCHVHYHGTHSYAMEGLYTLPSAAAGARIARSLIATLNAGFTSVRELGGYGADIARVVNEGWIPGPTIYSSVALLSQTGGHGDIHGIPLCDLHAASTGHRQLPIRICDGVADCIRAVREMQRRGAQVIKIAATGGSSTTGDDIQAQQFSDEEMAAIVSEAGRAGMAVAAHAHGKAGILAALRAGVKTIEHASFLDRECVDLILESGAMVVGTRGGVVFMAHSPQLQTPEQYQKTLALYHAHGAAYRLAIASGVKCAMGTDMLMSTDRLSWVHGNNGREIAYGVECGMTPLQAIEAATANGPETLGPRAPKSGILREGYDTDMISLREDPVQRIGVFDDARNVVDVWKGGVRVKRDGVPIGVLGDGPENV